MSTQTSELARELAFLDREFENAGDDEAVYRPGFDAAMADVRTSFGYDGYPLEEDVRWEWIHRFGELYDQTKSDEGLILIPNQNIQFAAVFLASCHVKRLGNTYSIPCDVFLA